MEGAVMGADSRQARPGSGCLLDGREARAVAADFGGYAVGLMVPQLRSEFRAGRVLARLAGRLACTASVKAAVIRLMTCPHAMGQRKTHGAPGHGGWK
jgi:hypothetical protein